MVEINYQNNLNEIDAKAAINPLLDCEPEIIVDESVCVKTEIDRLESCVPDYGAIYVPSTSHWAMDVANRQEDIISKSRKRLSSPNVLSTVNQEFIPKKRRESATQSLCAKRKEIAKTKSTSSESKINIQKPIKWQLPSNVEEIM